MLKQESRTFQIHLENVEEFLKILELLNIYPESNEDGFKFEVQHDNVVYEINMLIKERFTVDELLFMLNVYPHVSSFDDVQNKIFGRVIWKINN